MAIVGGFDIHRRQVTFDYLDTVTGHAPAETPTPGHVAQGSYAFGQNNQAGQAACRSLSQDG
jgi:hypothetical protein